MLIRILLISLFIFSNITFADQKDGQIEIKQIAKNVFLHTSYKKLPDYGYYPSNGLVVVNGKDAYIIDTPWPVQDIKTLVTWINDSGYSLKASISTHFHDDRVSGIPYLNRISVKTYASALTNRILESKGLEKAATGFEGRGFWLLEGVIYAYYPGPGHTEDNIVVWLPDAGILYGGCLIRSMSSKTPGNIEDASMDEWTGSIRDVMAKFPDAGMVIPGHGDPGGFELLAHTGELVQRRF